MFVVHVDRQRSFTGQIQRGLREVDALLGAGHQVGVIAHPGSALAERARERGVEVWELPMRGPALYTSIFRAARALRGRRVDVLHCHGGRDQVLALATAALAGVPHLVRTKHNHTAPRSWRHRLAYQRCDRIVTVSDYVRAELVGAGLEPARVVSVPTAIDVARFHPRPRDPALAASLGIGPDELIVGNVSSLHRRKGTEDLLHALAKLVRGPHGARVRGLLVGKAHRQWQPLVQQLGIGARVLFPGFRDDVPELLALFDVYALPSHHEALGTGALEAMASGLALVVSDVEGLAEAVAPGTGLRVPPGDPERLAAAIESLLGDPAQRRALGEAARARAVAAYDEKTLAARMLALYEEVLARGSRTADGRVRA